MKQQQSRRGFPYGKSTLHLAASRLGIWHTSRLYILTLHLPSMTVFLVSRQGALLAGGVEVYLSEGGEKLGATARAHNGIPKNKDLGLWKSALKEWGKKYIAIEKYMVRVIEQHSSYPGQGGHLTKAMAQLLPLPPRLMYKQQPLQNLLSNMDPRAAAISRTHVRYE